METSGSAFWFSVECTSCCSVVPRPGISGHFPPHARFEYGSVLPQMWGNPAGRTTAAELQAQLNRIRLLKSCPVCQPAIQRISEAAFLRARLAEDPHSAHSSAPKSSSDGCHRFLDTLRSS